MSICIFLIIKDVILCAYLPAVHLLFPVKNLFKSFAYLFFKSWIVLLSGKSLFFVFCFLSILVGTSPCQIHTANIFSRSVTCLSIFLIISLKEQRL